MYVEKESAPEAPAEKISDAGEEVPSSRMKLDEENLPPFIRKLKKL